MSLDPYAQVKPRPVSDEVRQPMSWSQFQHKTRESSHEPSPMTFSAYRGMSQEPTKTAGLFGNFETSRGREVTPNRAVSHGPTALSASHHLEKPSNEQALGNPSSNQARGMSHEPMQHFATMRQPRGMSHEPMFGRATSHQPRGASQEPLSKPYMEYNDTSRKPGLSRWSPFKEEHEPAVAHGVPYLAGVGGATYETEDPYAYRGVSQDPAVMPRLPPPMFRSYRW